MSQIEIRLDGRTYRVACEDGQEQRLLDLAQMIDGHIKTLVGQIGHVGHNRLLVMASLLVADELVDLREASDKSAGDAHDENRQRAADALEKLAGRIENIAERLEQV